jgi:iron(III) transport system substrate-binding protein
MLIRGRANARDSVTIYCAQDQIYSEPIFTEFTRQTGIKVRALYDSEAVKTVGLANRLLAERAHPQCDVFWGNEEFRTRQLEAAGVFREQEPWKEFGYRSRRIVINTKQLALADAPRRLEELTNAVWRGKIALAYPLFGSTATHFLALRQQWGETRWEAWCRALAANKPFLVDGNSAVVKLVARGEAAIGLTDSDDISAAQHEGLPVAALPITEDTLLIQNSVAVIRDAPRPPAARKLFEFLQSRAVAQQLIAANALEGSCACDVNEKNLQPRWDRVLAELEPATARLKEIFLR